MKSRTLQDIKQRIVGGEATVLTAEEVSDLVRNGEEPEFDEVDVVTSGTCGIMSGTAAIFHIKVGEPGSFKKANRILLNGVPGFPGPCPNEWLGSVDLIVYGTSHSIYHDDYGGGFLFQDIIKGNEVEVEVESISGDKLKTTVTMDDMGTAQMIGTRLAFKNYTAFVNPSLESVASIFNAVNMEGPFKGLSFSGCGELNPLQNDPHMRIIKRGAKVLLSGSEGMVLGQGTRSSDEKPNLMISADMHQMDPLYVGGLKLPPVRRSLTVWPLPYPSSMRIFLRILSSPTRTSNYQLLIYVVGIRFWDLLIMRLSGRILQKGLFIIQKDARTANYVWSVRDALQAHIKVTLMRKSVLDVGCAIIPVPTVPSR